MPSIKKKLRLPTAFLNILDLTQNKDHGMQNIRKFALLFHPLFIFQKVKKEKFTKLSCGMEGPKRKRPKLFRLDNSPKVLGLDIELLPNEILVKIFSYFNIKVLLKCGQVNKKFRQISHDNSFWKCVNLYRQRVSFQFVAHILQLGTEYLNLQEVILLGDGHVDIPQKNSLKYLNLAFSKIEDKFLVRLLRSSVSLEKLSFEGGNHNFEQIRYDEVTMKLRMSWFIECLLPNFKTLTTLDLSNSSVYQYKLDSESLKGILLNCVELKEANFEGAQITDAEFFVNNLTPKIEKLNISWSESFKDKHIVQMVKRCNNITELDLAGCDIANGLLGENQNALIAISENLSQSLVKLELPDQSIVYPDFLKSLPKLRYLWIHNEEFICDFMKEYPLIFLNKDLSSIANCAEEYFRPEKGFWEVNCASADKKIRR